MRGEEGELREGKNDKAGEWEKKIGVERCKWRNIE